MGAQNRRRGAAAVRCPEVDRVDVALLKVENCITAILAAVAVRERIGSVGGACAEFCASAAESGSKRPLPALRWTGRLSV